MSGHIIHGLLAGSLVWGVAGAIVAFFRLVTIEVGERRFGLIGWSAVGVSATAFSVAAFLGQLG